MGEASKARHNLVRVLGTLRKRASVTNEGGEESVGRRESPFLLPCSSFSSLYVPIGTGTGNAKVISGRQKKT